MLVLTATFMTGPIIYYFNFSYIFYGKPLHIPFSPHVYTVPIIKVKIRYFNQMGLKSEEIITY